MTRHQGIRSTEGGHRDRSPPRSRSIISQQLPTRSTMRPPWPLQQYYVYVCNVCIQTPREPRRTLSLSLCVSLYLSECVGTPSVFPQFCRRQKIKCKSFVGLPGPVTHAPAAEQGCPLLRGPLLSKLYAMVSNGGLRPLGSLCE